MVISSSPPVGASRRLARAVHELHPEISFSRAKRAVLEGQVTVDGALTRDPGAVVGAGAEVLWLRDRPAGRAAGDWVEIVAADASIVVVDKPAGLLTVPTPAQERDTLLSRATVAVSRRSGRRAHLSVVHRLDRDTSGLVVFGASRKAQAQLQQQLIDRSMGRIYDAWIVGELAGEAGSFDQNLIGDGLRRRRWVVRAGERGKAAVTHWQVVERYQGATRVRVTLETGRTHQIRIHFAAAGHPLLGEPVYRAPGVVPPATALARQALHAGELHFDHPAEGRRHRYEAPLPADLERLIVALRQGNGARPA